VVCDSHGVCKTDISGSPIPTARDWTMALLASYTAQLTDTVSWFINGDWHYQEGGNWAAVPKYKPAGYEEQKMDTFNFLNLSTGFAAGNYRFIFFVDNLTNAKPITTLRVDQIDRMQGETFGVRVTAKY
jgi:hypothetical protein